MEKYVLCSLGFTEEDIAKLYKGLAELVASRIQRATNILKDP